MACRSSSRFSIAIFNQFSGINARFSTTSTTSSPALVSAKFPPDLQAVAIGATNLLFTMLAMSIIDHVGRRTCLLIGALRDGLLPGGCRRHILDWPT